MTDTEEKTEFKISELSDRAKEAARNWYREWNQDDNWWEYIYDDAVTVGALMGIQISDHDVRGPGKAKPDIWFSGFHTQGSGCCYSGHLDIADMAGAVAKVKEYASEDEKLHSLAADAERIFTSIRAWLLTCKLKNEEPEWEDPLNAGVIIRGDERGYRTYTWSDDIASVLQKDMDRFVSDFASWIYKQLEAEDEYMNSDEYIDVNIEANEHLFDEFGRVI